MALSASGSGAVMITGADISGLSDCSKQLLEFFLTEEGVPVLYPDLPGNEVLVAQVSRAGGSTTLFVVYDKEGMDALAGEFDTGAIRWMHGDVRSLGV